MWNLMLAWGALGCGGEPPADDFTPSPWTYAAEDEAEPVFDAARVEAGLQTAIDLALGLGAESVLDGYFSMLAHADGTCPRWYETDGNVYWNDACTSQDGTWFDGYGFYYPYSQVAFDSSSARYDGHSLYGVATVRTAEGERLNLGGGLQTWTGYDPDYDGYTWISQVQGGFSWTDGQGWLAEGLSPDIYLYAVEYPQWQARGAYVHGAVGGLSGEVTAAWFEEAFLYNVALGSVCEREPSGAIELRDAEGDWWRVEFDTPAKGEMSPADCDGCGTVRRGGQVVGEACVDFSAWIEWEGRPW